MDLVLLFLQVIAVTATVVTVYLARQTVAESRRLRREYEHDRRLHRFERGAELVELIGAYVERGSYALAVETQASLRVVIAPTSADVPATRVLSQRAILGANISELDYDIRAARDELDKARL